MTTIVSVRRNNQVVIAGDGQVSLGNTVMKGNARKVRRLYNDKVLAGFAGGTADAFTLFERFEVKLGQYSNNLMRAAVELGKDWRTDKYLRNLEAHLAVCNEETSLLVAGTGEIIEPDDGIAAIGSGGSYALAAARALARHTDLDCEALAREGLSIAAEICIYTNDDIHVVCLP